MNEGQGGHMDKQALRTAYLVGGFIKGSLTTAEHDELDEWIAASDANMKLFEDLTDERNLEENMAWMDGINSMESFRRLQEKKAFTIPRAFPKKAWAAIAAGLLFLAAAFLLLRYSGHTNKTDIIVRAIANPGSHRAILKISDGQSIDLSKIPNGIVVRGIEKTKEGELVYAPTAPSRAAGYHTLSTSPGGQYEVVLPDGSRVWLNASTTLTYPARFDDSSRRVQLEGEAYFEVARDAGRPFHVQISDGNSIQVLGTHFNIMNYANEPCSKVTLLEGKIALARDRHLQELTAGEQFQLTPASVKKIAGLDTDEVLGWKNGLFIFHDADIATIMRQVSRWYDVEIEQTYQTGDLFNATIPRTESLQKLLHVLELTGRIHFRLENRKIQVLP